MRSAEVEVAPHVYVGRPPLKNAVVSISNNTNSSPTKSIAITLQFKSPYRSHLDTYPTPRYKTAAAAYKSMTDRGLNQVMSKCKHTRD